MSIVENIKFLCKENGTTIPKIGTELGFGNGAIYNWDKNSPSIDKVQKVADYFNVSVDKVLYGFELTRFEEMVRIIMKGRTCEEFAKDSGIELEIVEDIAMGLLTSQPSLDTVQKIAKAYPEGYEVLVGKSDLFKAAGYPVESLDIEFVSEKIAEEVAHYDAIQTIAAHHDGDDWTEEELAEIEKFKEFVRSKRQQG